MNKHNLLLTICGMTVIAYSACTQSPVGGDGISSGKMAIQGQVILSDSLAADGAYVWLEQFDIGARTDTAGAFEIRLPPVVAQGTPGGVSGTFKLYFYMTNYALNWIKVAVRNGEFIYGQGNVDAAGRFVTPVELDKFLDINTVVNPATITTAYSGLMDVGLHLRTPRNDSATVVFPGSFGREFGTVIVKNLQTGDLLLFQALNRIEDRGNATIIGHVERIVDRDFSVIQGVLLVGKYRVIAHMLINHESIPRGLLESIGGNFDLPDQGYLNLPMVRKGGFFEVVQSQ